MTSQRFDQETTIEPHVAGESKSPPVNVDPAVVTPKDLHGETIYVLGPSELQNRLFCLYLHEQLGSKCYYWQSLAQAAGAAGAPVPSMLMFDCMRMNQPEILDKIDWEDSAFKELNPHKTLFNVVPGTKMERRALTRGVVGFFYDHDPLELIVKGIRMVFDDDLWLPRKVFRSCLQDGGSGNRVTSRVIASLTQRELEILNLIAKGASNDDVAGRLFISPHTAKSHTHNIFKKIAVPNRLKAALWAKENL
jgi:DNA-binding NarL/FixJ family response regulator